MKHRLVLTLLLILVTVALATPAYASEGAKGKSILDLFKATGWVGVLMVLTSIVGTVLAIQNVVEIRMGSGFNALYKQIWEDLRDEVKRSYAQNK